MSRKIKRKVISEIYVDGRHDQTAEYGLYATDKEGNPTKDPFSGCEFLIDFKCALLGTKEGFQYIKGTFSAKGTDLIVVKFNTKKCPKFIVTKDEYQKAHRKFGREIQK